MVGLVSTQRRREGSANPLNDLVFRLPGPAGSSSWRAPFRHIEGEILPKAIGFEGAIHGEA